VIFMEGGSGHQFTFMEDVSGAPRHFKKGGLGEKRQLFYIRTGYLRGAYIRKGNLRGASLGKGISGAPVYIRQGDLRGASSLKKGDLSARGSSIPFGTESRGPGVGSM
jgi:hypothetical protein